MKRIANLDNAFEVLDELGVRRRLMRMLCQSKFTHYKKRRPERSIETVAEGGEVDWIAVSSTCSTKELFGIWDDEVENKRVIESEGTKGVAE
uniref:Uncharacterized protein n=1 Tax=Fagus sylvatica TaxID=28930 RepID=A0A2N9I898_FAGSY